MLHSGTETITTPRLILRRFVPEDCDSILKNWCSDCEIQHEYGEPVYTTPEAAEELLKKYISGYSEKSYYRWAVIERKSGENIGMTAFCRVYDDIRTAEIEYCIGKKYWGNGYAGEALSAVINYAFSTADFAKLEAYHRKENAKSGRVLAKSAMHITDNVERFRREGTTPEGEICYCIERQDIR